MLQIITEKQTPIFSYLQIFLLMISDTDRQSCGSGSRISKKIWIRILRYKMPHFPQKFLILFHFFIIKDVHNTFLQKQTPILSVTPVSGSESLFQIRIKRLKKIHILSGLGSATLPIAKINAVKTIKIDLAEYRQRLLDTEKMALQAPLTCRYFVCDLCVSHYHRRGRKKGRLAPFPLILQFVY